MRVFQRRQKIGQECLRPKHVVISEDRNGCLDRLETLNHLKTLVCFLCSEDLYVEQAETLAKLLKTINILFRCDNDDVFGIASCHRQNATTEFLVVSESWNDYCHIFGGESRWEERTDRFVGPGCEHMDNCASVSPKPILSGKLSGNVSELAWVSLPEADEQHQVLHLDDQRR